MGRRILPPALLSLFFHMAGSSWAETPEAARSFWDLLGDNVFLLTVFFLFASAVVTAILGMLSRDRCLKDFRGYPVLLELKNGNKLVWGVLEIYPNGLTLDYESPHQDPEGHVETSFILYRDEWPEMKALYRLSDELDEWALVRRRQEIRRTYQPSVFRRSARRVKNTFNTLRDAVVKSVGLVVGQAKKVAPASKILRTQDSALTDIGKTVAGYGSIAYDSILESLIGKKVVLEIPDGDGIDEFPGILKEYSSNFLEMLSLSNTGIFRVPLPGEGHSLNWRQLGITRKMGFLSLRNNGKLSLEIVSLEGDSKRKEPCFALSPGESREMELDGEVEQEGGIGIRIVGEVDLMIPRTHGRIRHAGEKETFNWMAFFGLH